MKHINYFFSSRNFFIFICILFLSQNVLAGKQYDERTLAADGGDDNSIKVKIENGAGYALDYIKVHALCTGESKERGINLRSKMYKDYAYWYLKPNCRYEISGRAKITGKNRTVTATIPLRHPSSCTITFEGSTLSNNIGWRSIDFDDNCSQ